MHDFPRCSECQVCLGLLLDGHTHLRVYIVMIYNLSCNLVSFSCHLSHFCRSKSILKFFKAALCQCQIKLN